MDVAVVAANPTAVDELGCKAHKPTVGVVVGCSGFAAYFIADVEGIAESTTGSAVDNTLEHSNHFVGIVFRDDFVHEGLEFGDYVAVTVFNLGNEEWGTAYAVVDEGCITTSHFAHGCFAWTEAENGGGVFFDIGVVEAEVVQDSNERRCAEEGYEVG